MTAQLVAVRTLSDRDTERVRLSSRGLVVARGAGGWTWVDVTSGTALPEEVAARLSATSPLAVLLTVGEQRSTVRVWRGKEDVVRARVVASLAAPDDHDLEQTAEQLARVFGVPSRSLVEPLRSGDPDAGWRRLVEALGIPLPPGLVPGASRGLVLDGVPGAVQVPSGVRAAVDEMPGSGRPQPSRGEKRLFLVALVALLAAVVGGAAVGDFRAAPLLVAFLAVVAIRWIGRSG